MLPRQTKMTRLLMLPTMPHAAWWQGTPERHSDAHTDAGLSISTQGCQSGVIDTGLPNRVSMGTPIVSIMCACRRCIHLVQRAVTFWVVTFCP